MGSISIYLKILIFIIIYFIVIFAYVFYGKLNREGELILSVSNLHSLDEFKVVESGERVSRLGAEGVRFWIYDIHSMKIKDCESFGYVEKTGGNYFYNNVDFFDKNKSFCFRSTDNGRAYIQDKFLLVEMDY